MTGKGSQCSTPISLLHSVQHVFPPYYYSTLFDYSQTVWEVLLLVMPHIGHILSKLHLANRPQATLYALRKRLASLNST